MTTIWNNNRIAYNAFLYFLSTYFVLFTNEIYFKLIDILKTIEHVLFYMFI